MREIMFRGKRLDNGEWAEGYLYEHEPALVGIASENDVPELSKWFIARTGFADWNMSRPVEFVEVAPPTVGQYAGLNDKHGKRIFEGDIVEGADFTAEDGGYGVVGFDDGAFEIIGNNCCGTFHENYWGRDFEVIGNIHDNPELLEEESNETD